MSKDNVKTCPIWPSPMACVCEGCPHSDPGRALKLRKLSKTMLNTPMLCCFLIQLSQLTNLRRFCEPYKAYGRYAKNCLAIKREKECQRVEGVGVASFGEQRKEPASRLRISKKTYIQNTKYKKAKSFRQKRTNV